MFQVITEYPIAEGSRDHIYPHGTKNDNSRWRAFNYKLYQLFPGATDPDNPDKLPIAILDLGCSGGGFVKDCLDDGCIAIGIEGSDFSLLSQRAEWKTIPEHLFTADVTKPFQVVDTTGAGNGDTHVKFDLITAWELMEHIPEDGLPQMLANCKEHLAEGGLMIFSVSPNEEFWHVCVHDKAWWLKKFEEHGLKNREDLVQYFCDDWIRGPKQGAPNSFHVVLEVA